MKKKFLSVIILSIVVLLTFSSYVFATENDEDVSKNIEDVIMTNVTSEDMVVDGATTELKSYSLDVEEDDEGNLPPLYDPDNSELIEHDVFLSEDYVTLSDTIYGNVYIIGDTVEISSYIDGNVYVLGKNILITGTVTGSIYALSSKCLYFDYLEVNSVYCIGKETSFGGSFNAKYDLYVYSTDVLNLYGNISRNIYGYANDIKVGPKLDTPFESGSIKYTGLCVDDNNILSNINLEKIEETTEEEEENVIDIYSVIFKIAFKAVYALFIIIVFYSLANLKSDLPLQRINASKDLLNAFSHGLLAIFVTPVALILIALTIVGIPISLLLLVLYMVGISIAPAIAALKVTEILRDTTRRDIIDIIFAIIIYIIYAILMYVPYIGKLLQIFVVIFGFGFLVEFIFKKRSNGEKDNQAITTDINDSIIDDIDSL